MSLSSTLICRTGLIECVNGYNEGQRERWEGGRAFELSPDMLGAPPLPDRSETITMATNLPLLYTGNHGNSC